MDWMAVMERAPVLTVNYHGREFTMMTADDHWVWWEDSRPTKVYASPNESLAYRAIEAYVAMTKAA